MKIIYVAIVVLLSILGVVLFNNSVGGGKTDQNSAVKLQAPPEYSVIHSDVTPEEVENGLIADIIINARKKNPLQNKIAIEFRENNVVSIFIIDFGADVMQKRMENSSGTIVESTWRGAVDRRIKLGAETGAFSGAGLSEPENKNLYH